MEKYLSWIAPTKFYFALDSIRSLDCLWACEDCLWRRHPEYQIASFVLQDLRSQRDSVVSKLTTNAIIRHLSKDIHKNEKYVFSSKSLRIVSITKMASHQGVDFFESHTCSGQSLDTNQERLLDQNTPAIEFPGEYALNVWVYEFPNKYYPKLHCLVPHVTEQAHFLIKELHIVSVTQFKLYGILHPVLLA